MSNEDKKFQEFVDSVRFDDTPEAGYRDKLEKQLIEAYDHEQKYGDYVEPVSLYMRKLAIAASFLIVCGLLFYGINATFIGEQGGTFAGHPDEQAIERIIAAEAPKGEEKTQLIAQIKDVWKMISEKDTDSLVAVVETDDMAYGLRKWAAKYLGRFGGQDTLDVLDATIEHLGITDPENPLMLAADDIRTRLGLEKPARVAPADANSNGSIQAVPGEACRPAGE